MELALKKTKKIYLNSFEIIIGFSVFVLLSLILLPLVASYVNIGSGFIRFSSLYLDINTIQLAIFIFVGLVSLLFISFFVSSIITLVKLQETLDQVGFTKVAHAFYKYVMRVFTLFIFMATLTILIGTGLDYLNISNVITQLILILVWIPFVFAPQVVVLEDYNLKRSILDSIKFIKRTPRYLFYYFIVGFILVFLLTLVEVILGYVFVWEHKIITIILLSMFVLPFMIIFGTEMYLRRYPLHHTKK